MLADNANYANMGRVSVASVSAILDLLYNKILLISESTRSTSAQGNLVNLLYTDSQRIQMVLQNVMMFFQIPIEIIVYLIYLIVQVNPIALVGLGAFVIFIPLLLIIMKNIIMAQKRIMSARDLRIKRANEIL